MGERVALGLDSDGVIYDTHVTWVEEFEKVSGRKITVDFIDTWDFFDKLGITRGQMLDVFERCWDRHGDIPLVDDRIPELVDEQVDLGFEPRIVTVKTHSSYCRLLARANSANGLNIPVFCCSSRGEKRDALCSVYVDDDPHLFGTLHGDQSMVLFSRGWNLQARTSGVERLERGFGWDGTMDLLRAWPW